MPDDRKIISAVAAFITATALMTSCGNVFISGTENDPVLSEVSRETEADHRDNTSEDIPDDFPSEGASNTVEEGDMIEVMVLYINDERTDVIWEENDAVDALRELAAQGPVTIDLSMYGGFEQVGPVGQELPSSDRQITTSPGDIVLYSGDQIVVFYGTNSWSYTRLGHITDKDDAQMEALLSGGDVRLTIRMES